MLMHWHGHAVHLGVILRVMTDFQLRSSLDVSSAASVHPPIPPVLDGVVTSTTQPSCNLRPALAHLRHHLLDQHTLFGRDGLVVEVGLEVLVEPLSALLGRASLDGLGDSDPVVGAMKVDQGQENRVFRLRPGATLMLRHVDVLVLLREREEMCLEGD